MNMMISPKRKLVVIGNGMAGMRTVEEILARAPGMFEITVFGAEPQPNYDRIMLSPLLAGDKTFEQIVLNPLEWYHANKIELITGEHVDWIDRAKKTIRSKHGTERPYDLLLLATGSNPFVLPLPGAARQGVMTFRSVADVEDMLAIAAPGKKAVVIGGGLLGLEAAHGLNLRGMDVSVVHLMPTLMERQLDSSAAHLLERALTKRGMSIYTGANTEAFLGADDHDESSPVTAVRLKDGREIEADLVVMAVGIRPNSGLARAVGLTCERGVVVNDAMQTSDPAIYAIGECVEHKQQIYGLVAPIWDMAKVAADNICNIAASSFTPAAAGTRLKVSGIEMFSAGEFLGDKTTEDVVLRDAARGVYKRLVLRGDKLVGVVCFGDARDAGWYFQLLRVGEDLGELRETMIFGPVAAAGNPDDILAAMSDNTEICGCNGVKKSTILAAIAEHGLTNIDDVRARTKASASCGSCIGLVEGLLKLQLGSAYAPDAVKPMCKCTIHGHDEVRRRIISATLKSIPAVMQALEWTTPDGCASCRPALNFYLIAAWPGKYEDDSQSRFVNERMHANIQKDGTYSVVPRMWGGTTTARELRAIADVVDKFNIPEVKVTGGQRIDMLGIKKEDLRAVWQDLNAAGLVSGHAYGKALRTVKTCVGSEWCRFGVQDSTAMGIALEKATWGSWHPHKVKLAVSGCPRNCAEATIKDFGVVATEAGWDLHVGGNGGIKVRATELLCKVTTEEEVMEYCFAFLQLYRMEARYLERTAPWMERVGLKYVQDKIVDNEGLRKQLAAEFVHSQTFMQNDPWAEQTADKAAQQKFNAMAELV